MPSLTLSAVIGDERTRIAATADLVKALPEFNKFTLQFLMEFLYEVQNQKKKTAP